MPERRMFVGSKRGDTGLWRSSSDPLDETNSTDYYYYFFLVLVTTVDLRLESLNLPEPLCDSRRVREKGGGQD